MRGNLRDGGNSAHSRQEGGMELDEALIGVISMFSRSLDLDSGEQRTGGQPGQ